MRVAYTMEQCWHRVPGGTAVAALRVAATLRAEHPDVELCGVAGRHRRPPQSAYAPTVPTAQLPLAGPYLYEAWLRAGWPKVESVTGPVDLAHATSIIPCATASKLVVTVHDLAFLHDPSQFTPRGVKVFRRSLDAIRRRADLVLCSSSATMDDCLHAGIPADRLRLVLLGVDVDPADGAAVARVRARLQLPERYLLFVGTVEPRKNLRGLVDALAHLPDAPPLIVGGAEGWGDTGVDESDRVRFLGFVPQADLDALYAGAEVFCFPSHREGFGLPVLEAMAQGTPVVTSRGTSTEEAAGGAAVLVDPEDPADIARGIDEALRRHEELRDAGRAHALVQSWSATAAATVAAYRELV